MKQSTSFSSVKRRFPKTMDRKIKLITMLYADYTNKTPSKAGIFGVYAGQLFMGCSREERRESSTGQHCSSNGHKIQ